MSSPGQQQGGGGQGGAGSGGQSSPKQPSTTSSITSHTSTSISNSPTSTSSSSGTHQGAIIGGIVGGVAVLLLISLLGVWLLQRRKQRQKGAGKTRPVTYAGLNSVFRGVPFTRSSSQSPHNSLLPQPQVSQGLQSSLALRGGAASCGQRESGSEMDNLPPSYADSQMSASVASLGRLNTAHRTNSDTIVSPLSARVPGDAHTISPQTTGASTFMSLQRLWAPNEPHMISPQLTGISTIVRPSTIVAEETRMLTPQPTGVTMPVLLPQYTSDTMGFPLQSEGIHLPPAIPTPIVSPVPRHPLVHQDSLERVVRQGLMPSDSPEPSNLNPDRLRVISQEMTRESPILGLNSIRIAPQAAGNDGLRRNDTQRTVSSVSSMGISVVSDGELERLGVGVDSMARYDRAARDGAN
jgi:hypothetical protein